MCLEFGSSGVLFNDNKQRIKRILKTVLDTKVLLKYDNTSQMCFSQVFGDILGKR